MATAAQTQTLIYQVQLGGTQQVNNSINDIIQRQKELKKIIASIPAEGTAAYAALDASIRAASNGTQTLASVTRDLTNQYARGRAAVNDFNRSLNQGVAAAGSINDLRNKVIQLNRELDNTAMTINGKTNPAYVALAQRSAALTAELRAAEAESGRFQRNVGNYPAIGDSIVSTFQQVGETLFAAFSISSLINEVKQGFQTMLDFGKSFERTKSTLLGLFEGADISELTANAKELGAATEFSGTQVGNLQIAFKKLGFSKQEILDTTEATLDLATATGSDLARSAEVAGSTLRAYGLETSNATRVIDIMAKSFSNSALDLEKFAESQKLVGPIAKSLNFTIEDTTALLAVLADAGISGSLAGTALRNSFLKVADPASSLNKKLVTLDESFKDGVQGSAEYLRALDLLGKAGIDLGEVLELSDKRSVSAFATLISSSDKVDKLSDAFTNAAGSGKKMADIIRADIQGEFDVLDSATEDVYLTLFEKLQPAILLVIQSLTAFMGFLNGLINALASIPKVTTFVITALSAYSAMLIFTKVQIFGVTAAEVAKRIATIATAAATEIARIAGLAYAVVQALIAGNSIAAAIGIRGLSLAIASNPIGLIAVGAALAVTALVALIDTTKELTREQKFAKEMQDDLAEAIAKETAESKKLFTLLKTENISKERRNQIIQEINENYGRYLPNLLTEASTLGDIEKAQKAVNAALIDKIKLQIREQKITEAVQKDTEVLFTTGAKLSNITGKSIDEISEAVKFANEEWEKFGKEFKDANKESTDGMELLKRQFAEYAARAQELQPKLVPVFKAIAEAALQTDETFVPVAAAFDGLQFSAFNLEKELVQIEKVLGSTAQTVDGPLEEGVKNTAMSVSELQDQVQKLKKTQALQTDAEGWKNIGKQIAEVELKIKSITGESSKTEKQSAKNADMINRQIERLNELVRKEQDAALAEDVISVETLTNKQKVEERKAEATFERIDKERAALIAEGVDEAKLLELTEQQRNTIRENLRKVYAEKIKDFVEKENKAYNDAIKVAVEETITTIEDTENQKLLALEKELAKQRGIILEAGVKTEADREEQSRKLGELDKRFQAEALLIQIEGIKQKLKIADLADKDRVKIEGELLKSQREFADLEVDIVRDREQRKADLVRRGLEIQKEAMSQLNSAISQISQIVQSDAQTQIDNLTRLNEARQSSFDQDIARHERELQVRIEQINASNLSAFEKERQVALLVAANAKEVESIKTSKEKEEAAYQAQQKAQEERQQRAVAFEKKIQAAQQVIANAKVAMNSIKFLSDNLAAVGTAAAVPFPANLAAIITVIAAIASAIASIRTITQGAAKFETGGFVGRSGHPMYAGGGDTSREGRSSVRGVPRRQRGQGGLHRGPRHSGGGITIEVEGGEFEMNREATDMFLPNLVWMNRQGLLRKAGKPHSRALPDTSPSGINVGSLNRVVTVPVPNRVFQTGGFVTGGGGSGIAELSGVLFQMSKTFENGFEGLQRSNEQISQGIRNQKVTLSLIELRDENAKLSLSESQSFV
jgi:TP901 family phage tail tape measure protein